MEIYTLACKAVDKAFLFGKSPDKYDVNGAQYG